MALAGLLQLLRGAGLRVGDLFQVILLLVAQASGSAAANSGLGHNHAVRAELQALGQLLNLRRATPLGLKLLLCLLDTGNSMQHMGGYAEPVARSGAVPLAGATHGLANPIGGISQELHRLLQVEAIDSVEQADGAFLNQVLMLNSATGEITSADLQEGLIGLQELFTGTLVAGLGCLHQPPLSGRGERGQNASLVD